MTSAIADGEEHRLGSAVVAPHLQKFCGQLVKQKLFAIKELESIYRAWRITVPNARDDLQSLVNFVALRGNISLDKLQELVSGIPPQSISQQPQAEPEFEVELVSIPDPKRIGRRDLIILGIGILLGGGIVGIIVLVIRLAR
jgi:hypothetical protein